MTVSPKKYSLIEDATPIFVKDVVRMKRMRPGEGKCDNHPVEEGPGAGSQSDATADPPTDRRIGCDGAHSDAISEGARVHGDIGSPTDVPPSTSDP